MSRQLTNLRDSKLQQINLRDFTNSVDVKRFSKERGNMTPLHHNTNNYFKKIYQRSNEKIRNTQPTSLAVTFSKNISQKNMQTKRKLSSGLPNTKINHHSVSLDQHLLKQKYDAVKQMFQGQKYQKLIPMVKHIIHHFQYSNAQKNLYYWLSIALLRQQRYQEGIQQISECLSSYHNFQEGYLCLACLYIKLKRYKNAIDAYHVAININNKSPAPYIQLAYCYQQLSDKQKTYSFAKQALQRFPKESQLLMICIQTLLESLRIDESISLLKDFEEFYPRKDSLLLYSKGLIEKSKGNESQAYILFQQSLKYNNNKIGVNKSLLQTIKIETNMRDFYKAHHTLKRIKFLQIEQTEEIRIYSIFIEGAMTMMKKKSQQAIQILAQISVNKKCEQMKIDTLIHKFYGYGYFKLSEYSKSIKHYQKIRLNQMDQSSKYNKLLAQGIQLADKDHHFTDAIVRFNEAKKVYPQKVEPYIYIAMTIILKQNIAQNKDETKLAEALIQALKQLQAGNKLNPNSSNLLFHRTIIHLYFEDWQEAHNDINKCIQKAQQNLPKYFYLRGVCYTCIRDFKKAINEFSICLSLDANYCEAHLEKAKCYFLLGNTDKGFSSLKLFMELKPNDLSIYKWIGDLLYEGMSYKDALKAYNQLGDIDDLQTHVMKLKCIFRVSSFNQSNAQLRLIEKHSNTTKEKITLDLHAVNLLNMLLKFQMKSVGSMIKKINKNLQTNNIGYLFQLVDCMNLIGVASFYLEKYGDAYESFLLVLELYQSLSDKETISLKSQCCDEDLNLRVEDIYFNIILCELAQGNITEAIRMISQEYINIMSDAKKKKNIERLIKAIDSGQQTTIQIELKNDRPFNYKFKKVDIPINKIILRSKPLFNLYHDSASHLYSSTVAQKLIAKLHVENVIIKTGFIDNMPEGPWIRRNPYGVVFTDQVMHNDNSISFEDTPRVPSSKQENSERSVEEEETKKTISKREQFLKRLKFDEAVEAKLNSMIQKAQSSQGK